MMTKKDFEALAGALKESAASAAVVGAVSRVCAASNPAFKADRFTAAAMDNSPLAVLARRGALEYHKEGELEIDDEGAPVSLVRDDEPVIGAYVAMWRWVDFDEQDVKANGATRQEAA